jgi:HK97 family phage major capsid protein
MSTELRAAVDIDRELKERSRELAAKQNQLHSIYTSTRDAEGNRVVQPHQVDEIHRLEAASKTLTQQVNSLKFDWAEALNREALERNESDTSGAVALFDGRGGMGGGGTHEGLKANVRLPESVGSAFVEGKGYKSWVPGGQGQIIGCEIPALNFRDYAFREAAKATLTTATGPFTLIEKQPSVIALGQQMLTVADLLSTAQTNSTTIRYIQEDSFTNTAGMVAEDAQKPELTWDLSEVDAAVKKIAVVSRTTTEMMEDYAQIQDYINQRMPFAVQQREEFQLINGDGTGNNLLGVYNVAGVLTQAKGANTNIDSIYLAMTKVRTQGFWEPDALVIHPDNWSVIRLTKTTQGEYVYGDPWVPGPETIFGLRVVKTVNATVTAPTPGPAVVGNWRLGGTVFYRRGIRIEATNSDANDFSFNRVALRAEQREAVAWWRPKAFCKVTGLDVPV